MTLVSNYETISRSTCDYASSESSFVPGTSCLDSGLAAITALKCYEKPIKNFSGKCEPNNAQINPITVNIISSEPISKNQETSCFDCDEMCIDANCQNYNTCLNDPAMSANSKICSTDGCSLLLRESNKYVINTNTTRSQLSTTKMVSRSCYQSGMDVSKFKSRYETAQCKQDLCNKSHLFDYPQICLPPPTTRPITTISTTSAAVELSTTAGIVHTYSFLNFEIEIMNSKKRTNFYNSANSIRSPVFNSWNCWNNDCRLLWLCFGTNRCCRLRQVQ